MSILLKGEFYRHAAFEEFSICLGYQVTGTELSWRHLYGTFLIAKCKTVYFKITTHTHIYILHYDINK